MIKKGNFLMYFIINKNKKQKTKGIPYEKNN